MKKTILFMLCAVMAVAFLSGCDPISKQLPANYPNTRWVSEDPDMFFIPGKLGETSYAQIIINGEVVELLAWMGNGAGMDFYDATMCDMETKRLLPEYSGTEALLFSGLGIFRRGRVIMNVTNNPKGFLDESITTIIFIREDIEPLDD
jgi:hypothetical protein